MNFAVILSGGVGSRFGAKTPKQYLQVKEKPIIIYTLEKFCEVKEIDKIIIVAAEQWHSKIAEWLKEYKIKIECIFAKSGDTRQESILNGLIACNSFGESDKVIIHDAVRPLIPCDLIKKCLVTLNEADAVMPVLPVQDTVYVSENGSIVTGLLNRDSLYAGQAPEGYKLKNYLEINSKYTKEQLMNIRGSSELAFLGGMTVRLVDGDSVNFKITTPQDLERFERKVEGKEQ